MIPWRRHIFLIEKDFHEELESNGKKKEGMENSRFYRLCCIAVGMRKTSVEEPTLAMEVELWGIHLRRCTFLI
jgi:hypothetical protein